MSEPAFTEDDLVRLSRELRRVWHQLVKGIERHAEGEALARQQVWVLAALSSGPRRMSDLAESAGTSQASLTGIVDRLVERGLVDRRRSLEDRRVVEVAMTDEGREAMARSHAGILASLAEALAPLDDEERARFLELVSRIGTPEQENDRPCI